ncbi:hypothetical protein SLS58_000767 [Diplodia intermedia]|uniref:Uncharacterized protein n=1 Tax=Diplodia intermedia TaxID=856260 RepID=A0ABR3U5V5_9PEZI
MAPSSPTSPRPSAQARRRSSIFSGFASLSLTSSHNQGRRGSKWSITSCFSESSNPDKEEGFSRHDYSPPVSPVAASFDQSTITSKRRSYVPKRGAEPFSISTTPMAPSKRMSYATQYGYRTPVSMTPVEIVVASKQ